jgi:ABC-type bacteriocin/lantibiotic exporter with double-glycine peptidase domain
MDLIINFKKLKQRNKIAFTIITAFAVVLFWKGAWVLSDIVIDEILFQGHIFWANVFALLLGIILLSGGGVLLEKLV